ncbi:hypothetical protein CC86DRAFT_78579 [Ophiobolus disseminans]|uniref:Uncharacterized protein n=1 Tax=Ophiobolus disseminans TaxID=1469910 RepID=A0A6A6ZMX0_9PLEO|nr:hypothetical protein CC86DRAFT_78579 [Ophiobolus disseminans]
MVQDPNFWKRFSTAVHADDAAKEGRADLKHSYVPSQSQVVRTSAAPILPPISPSFSPIDYMQSLSFVSASAPASASAVLPPPPPPSSLPRRKEEWEKSEYNLPLSSTTPSAPAPAPIQQKKIPKRQPSKLRKSPSTRSTHPLLTPLSPPAPPPPTKPPHRCPSSLSLNLSGRSKAHFHTWTTITADAARRDSWLEAQNKKSRQRAWICWAFWGAVIVLVTGVVVAVVVLRAHGVI